MFNKYLLSTYLQEADTDLGARERAANKINKSLAYGGLHSTEEIIKK